ncbi:MAG: phosphoribosylamine--glycine ligase [Patescibacteria group bacterium]
MRILIVGSKGSEHALAWKISQSPLVTKVVVTPGNAGWESLGIVEADEIIAYAKTNADLVLVREDTYLASGLVDALQDAGLLVFGPTKAAAKIEWSKGYAKEVMLAAGIRTARSRSFSNQGDAVAYIEGQEHPLVIKADGLVAGKGVVISQSVAESEAALHTLGMPVVIEEYMQGREISVHALCDGERAILFPPSQDHKRAYDNNEGPNTGGMGTIAPVPGVTAEDMRRIEQEVVRSLLAELRRRGTPFKGILFPGIMLTAEGPKVIEFNARFGDPETQSYMRLLQSDLIPALIAVAQGDISDVRLEWRQGSAATVILASGGYPGDYQKGLPVTLPEPPADVIVFHSGTALRDGQLVTAGGRVLGVSATGADLDEALGNAYSAASQIHFDGMHFRRDIGAYGG